MSPASAVSAEHQIKVMAPAEAVYRLLADADAWPAVFAPFVHLKVLGASAGATPAGLDSGGSWEKVAVWSHAGDELHRWVKHRALREERLRIDYYPDEIPPPLASMARSFVIEPIAEQESVVRLLHLFRAVDDDPAALATIRQTIDGIAEAELAAVKAAAEPLARRPEVEIAFADTVLVHAAPSAVHSFLWEVRAWPERLPHVSDVRVHGGHPDRQIVETATLEPNGGTLTTRTAQLRLSDHGIVYKHLQLPPLARAHLVRWSMLPEPSGHTAVTAQHRVVFDEAGVRQMLGPDADLATAAGFARQQIMSKTRLVLDAAKAYTEGAHA